MKTLRITLSRVFLWCCLFQSWCPLLRGMEPVDLSHDNYGDIQVPPDAVLDFIDAGDRLFVVYTDPEHGRIRIHVPRYFFKLSHHRIVKELNHAYDRNRWSERVILEIFFYAVTYGSDYKPPSASKLKVGLETGQYWLDETISICKWEGITCGPFEESTSKRLLSSTTSSSSSGLPPPPKHSVTKIDLMEFGLTGTLPKELSHLHYLQYINLNGNKLHGPIPYTWGTMVSLRFLDLGENDLSGPLPALSLGTLAHVLEEVWLEKNDFYGPIDEAFFELTNCRFMDFSENKLTGTLNSEIGLMESLGSFFAEENKLTGTLPTELGFLSNLRVIDLGVNDFTGQIPSEVGYLSRLIDFNVASNRLSGHIPPEMFLLTNLEVLMLSENELTGHLPLGDDILPNRVKDQEDIDEPWGFNWSDFSNMVALAFDRNNIMGKLPPGMLYGLGPSLTSLDIGFNFLTGSLPPEIGRMTELRRFTAPFNFLLGTLPFELGRMKELILLNLTANLFTGTVPKALCGEPILGPTLTREFGCDSILCPPGTFHPEGAASLIGGCIPCPKTEIAEAFIPPLSTVLGRSSCESASYRFGDLDADGVVSPREVLRLFYIETDGENWGSQFRVWHELSVHECNLPGISCVNNKVTKIDLSDAELCSDGRNNEGSAEHCPGLPGELRYLSDSLEVLKLPRRRFLRGVIPSEIGELTKLRILDLSVAQLMSGTIPSEIGNLSNLQQLNLASGNFNGTIPSELYGLTNLEKLNLSLNPLTGTFASEVSNLKSIKEMLLSRAYLNGTLPSSIGDLPLLENLELYGNAFSGTLPSELGKLSLLRRIDLFNNKFTGTIPDALGTVRSLQIVHFKKNRLTGTIPSTFGSLMHLVWLDVSINMLSGTIPSGFGSIRLLKDFRLHGNRIYDPIPQSLCTHSQLNGGQTATYGCDAVVCPLGTFSSQGFSSDSDVCEKCPPGKTTVYLGSTECVELDNKDILSMLYDVLDGDEWPDEFKRGWKDERTSVCEWAGVTCNDKDDIIGLSFPGSKMAQPFSN